MKACGRQDPHPCTLGAHLAQPRCAHCSAPDVIREDGGMTLVCPRCIRSLVRIAWEPFSVPDVVRQRLLDDSLDVVGIRDGAWAWTSLWPSTGDSRCLDGRVADGRLRR